MIFLFIHIRKGPPEVLKTSRFTLGFQQFPRDIANVNEWKIMFDSSIDTGHWTRDVYVINSPISLLWSVEASVA